MRTPLLLLTISLVAGHVAAEPARFIADDIEPQESAGMGGLDVLEIDRPGIRVGVKEGSAYDLFLTRTLKHATIVRGAEGVDLFHTDSLDAGAGIRKPVEEFAARTPGTRVIPARFMEIRQAVCTPKRHADTTIWLTDQIENDRIGNELTVTVVPSSST